MFENRRWLVIPTERINEIDFSEVLETSEASLRKSLDQTLTFIKYDVNVVEESYTETFVNTETSEEETHTIEAGVYGRPSIYSDDLYEYNHEEILALLATDAWSSNEDIE